MLGVPCFGLMQNDIVILHILTFHIRPISLGTDIFLVINAVKPGDSDIPILVVFTSNPRLHPLINKYDMAIMPRLIRLKDASKYLGMDKNRFNYEVRPKLIAIPIGKQGIAFDRLDLDAWVEQYKHCNGRPA